MARETQEQVRQRELAAYREQGAETYADRRLLDITEAVVALRSLVQVLVVVVLLSVLIGVVAVIAAAN